MWLKKLKLQNFRNHEQIEIEFGSGINILWGKNGQGKTSILEAIYYLCLSKSFRTKSDKETISFDKNFFEIEATNISDHGQVHLNRIYYSREDGKRIFIDKKPVHRFSAIIGDFPLISLFPSNREITFGPPAERRKFLDSFLSQSSKLYLADHLEYRRALKQRNTLLSQKKIDARVLEIWDEEIIKYGSRIIIKRRELLSEFSDLLHEIYNRLTSENSDVIVHYQPVVDAENEKLPEVFLDVIRKNREIEIRQHTSVIGPHRDKIDFVINRKSLRKYGSQGEHKTLLIALKIAEYIFVKKQKEETPIFLLDDPFAELDKERTSKLLSYIKSIGQVFMTVTNKEDIERYGTIDGQSYAVEQGKILTQENE